MKKAYFSLATDDYTPGAVCLVKSLRRQTDLPIKVLEFGLSEENRKLVEAEGAECVRVKKITSAKARTQPWHGSKDFAGNTYNKLHLWVMPFDKVIFIDADMVVLKSLDHLFDQDTGDFAAVPSFTIQQDASGKALKRFWDEGHFNSGLLIIRPDKERFEDLLWLKDTLVSPASPLDTTEQSFLNAYFKNRWHPLGREYNGFKRVYQMFPDLWEQIKEEVHTIHYNLEKPWDKLEEMCDGIEKIWWDYYKS